MKKSSVIFLFFITCIQIFSQSNSKWSDLFSYNNVLAFKESKGKIVAATENGVFYYDMTSGEIKKLSKVNGLHEVKISAFDYNAETNTALIGYQSGNIDVVTEDAISYVVDIPLSQSYSGSKVINHISIKGNQAVISAGYGVSIFNMSKKEFGDTCFFFNDSGYEKVLEATIYNNTVYAVTGSSFKYHPIDVTFSVFSTWSSMPGSYRQIDSGDKIILGTESNVYYGDINGFSAINQSFLEIKDVQQNGGNIIVADQRKVYVYNSANGVLLKTVDVAEDINTANFFSNQVFIGTKYSGIYDENKNSYKPDGPYSNISYKINLLGNQIWVATGGRDSGYNGIDYYSGLGYYHYDGTKWYYPDYFKTTTFQWNVLDVEPNPVKPTEVFFTNYSFLTGQKGIYKMDNNNFVKAYLQDPDRPFLNRPVGLSFDDQNNLFCSVGFIDIPNKATAGYYFYDKTADNFVAIPIVNAYRVQDLYTKDGVAYIPAPYNTGGGLIIYKYNNTPLQLNDDAYQLINKTNGMPEDGVICSVIDQNDDIWIGGYSGLRILPNASEVLTTQTPKAEPIVITQNNIPEELFKDLKITSLDVDSGNQKWVSVEGGGVFYLSANGENTIQHFTKLNSPLPNDTVTDIKIDQKTGKIYFATYDGIVVYQGDIVNVTRNFGQIKVYPNPVVTAQYKGSVKITGLAEKTNIRITDAAGNVVHQAVARGGFYEWDLNNQRGQRVASGVYFVLMTNEDGTDKATAKIAVVN